MFTRSNFSPTEQKKVFQILLELLKDFQYFFKMHLLKMSPKVQLKLGFFSWKNMHAFHTYASEGQGRVQILEGAKCNFLQVERILMFFA